MISTVYSFSEVIGGYVWKDKKNTDGEGRVDEQQETKQAIKKDEMYISTCFWL